MFMDGRKTARPLPRDSIIKEGKGVKEGKEVKEVKEGKEVREETQRNRLAEGAAEKMCYDANRRVYIARYGKSGQCRQPSCADDECRSCSSFAIQPSGTPSC
jgi:hypothetical protein